MRWIIKGILQTIYDMVILFSDNLKYRCNALFRKDLFDCKVKQPVEDVTNTKYVSNLSCGATLVGVDGKKCYFGCNVLGILLKELRENKGKLKYELPEDMHLFGKPIMSNN